jgi:hypothetical protein
MLIQNSVHGLFGIMGFRLQMRYTGELIVENVTIHTVLPSSPQLGELVPYILLLTIVVIGL